MPEEHFASEDSHGATARRKLLDVLREVWFLLVAIVARASGA